MRKGSRRVPFLLFFASGACSLTCAVVWLRVALASFGAITPVASGFNSVFMLGTALGAFWGGRLIAPLWGRAKLSPQALYAIAQMVAAVGAVAVPGLFSVSRQMLLGLQSLDSLGYLSLATLLMGVATLPFTFAMGASFPFMMAALRGGGAVRRESGFGLLYLANSLGGVAGAFAAAFLLIELNGLRGTLVVVARLDVACALAAILVLLRQRREASRDPAARPWVERPVPVRGARVPFERLGLLVLGFCLFAWQSIWVRLYAPIVGTTIYGFVGIMMLCLVGGALGTWVYLKSSAVGRVATTRECSRLIGYLAGLGLAQVFLSGREPGFAVACVVFSILPLCAIIGYVVPLLVMTQAVPAWRDPKMPLRGWSPGQVAGRAYAAHVLGCVLGPLVAVYALMPHMNERAALLAIDLALLVPIALWSRTWVAAAGAVAMALALAWCGRQGGAATVFRDHTASVEVREVPPESHGLFVNSIEVARQSTAEKMMAHLPLALHRYAPVRSVLILGLGTGTALRSVLSWGDALDVTVVEMLPSVVRALDSVYPGATASLARNPRAHLVLDEPRRFLSRASLRFDVIIVNPTSTLESASSSQHYSTEFYELAKSRLAPDGILSQWYLTTEMRTLQAVVRSLLVSFPSVEGTRSWDGNGAHFLASSRHMPHLYEVRLVAAMPASAVSDLREWLSDERFALLQERMSKQVIRPTALVSENENVVVTDDRPYNEFYGIRRSFLFSD